MKVSILEFMQDFTHVLQKYFFFHYFPIEMQNLGTCQQFFQLEALCPNAFWKVCSPKFQLSMEQCSFDDLEKYAAMKWKENIVVFLWFGSSALK